VADSGMMASKLWPSVERLFCRMAPPNSAGGSLARSAASARSARSPQDWSPQRPRISPTNQKPR